MSYTVVRKEGENPDQLLVRFNKATSHFTKALRRTQRKAPHMSHLKKKVGALVREGYRAERERKKFYS